MNAAWAAVIGGISGGFFSALTAIVTARFRQAEVAGERNHQRQLETDRRLHESEMALREHRVALIAQWRDGVRATYAAESAADIQSDAADIPLADRIPMMQSWFHSLRPHLPPDLADDAQTYMDYSSTLKISDEIARVERDWKLV